MDLNSEIYIRKEKEFLDELKKDREEIEHIQKSTIGQASNSKWLQERSLRITASNFGKICKMRPKTSLSNTIKNLLYGTFTGNKATKYGNESEARAILEFEKMYNLKVAPCGLFIGEKEYYLAASPDGFIIENDFLIEVKCPFTIAKMNPTEGIQTGKITFATIVDGALKLKRNHNYYYQVQGQLAIANKQICYFIIWSPFGILIEQVKVTYFISISILNEITPIEKFYIAYLLFDLEFLYFANVICTKKV